MGETEGAATGAMVGTPQGMASHRAYVKETSSWKRILLLAASCFWFCITASLSFSIRFMSRRLFRVRREEDGSRHRDSNSTPTQPPEKRIEAGKSEEEDLDASKEQDAPVFQFRFSFRAPEESSSSGEVQGDYYSGGERTAPSMATSISNYRFAPERDLKGFLERPPATTMCVQESYIGSDGVVLVENTEELDTDLKNRFLSEREFESEIDEENLFELDRENQGSEETRLPGSSADSAEDMIMHNSLTPTALHDDVLLDGEAELELWREPGTANPISGDDDGRKESRAPPVTDHSHNSQTSEGPVSPDHLVEGNSYGQGQRWEDPVKEAHSEEGSDDSQGTHLGKAKELSMEESEELESLWEHQDLVDQLKMELKKVRSIGLPTILEESESPKPTEDPKPWKFDAKFLHEDPMDELHKLYKSYRERMRKFDILNYQKMYAVGFLQVKDPLHSIGIHKPFIPTITSLLSHNIWPRRRKCGADPSEKFAKELQGDLEMVYVGQSCLSWEFLRWQYERTRELLDCDSQDGRQYNQVAGEFQQFQVLIQRFLEDEPFQGPRVPNYVKNRCVLRSLLQVPVIREDCLRDKIEEQSKWEEAVTSEQLEYVMGSSMRVFWEFVKADKGDTPLIMKGLIGSPAEQQDPVDRELMADIQTNLHKKEKKLKDILKTSGCLMKKFKKPRDGRSIQDDLFFSQVDLKLVSRVLKMARITTDQLVWCHKKLSKITFVERKLVRKPSFFLFPC